MAAAVAAALWLAAPAQAQTVAAGSLKDVVVSGSRSEQAAEDLPASIDVIDRKEVEEKQIRDIRDLVRELPNVSVQRAPARFTLAGQPAFGRDRNAGFNIRGLDGNRVLILVDGIRQPRSYTFAANAFGRDYLDVGLVQRVEVLRGSASALYGSDSLGGLVNFITLDPAAFLGTERNVGGTASVGYDGDSDAWRLGGTVAMRASESAQWLLGVTGSKGHALENMGSNDAANVTRTTPNPEDNSEVGALAKLVLTPGGGQRHVFTLEHVEKNADYELLSNIARPPLAPTSTIGASAFTDQARTRATWDGRWRLDAAAADELQAVLSWQDVDAREYSFEDRFTAADRIRDTTYSERTWQAVLQANKLLRQGGDVAHKLTYGAELVRSEIRNQQTGMTPAAGERFPLKRFPDTREGTAAFYVQDEIVAGRWSVVPGVRFDRFEIDASQAGFSPPATTPAASLSGSATSPKLGVLFRATQQWSVFGNYAQGFKAPNAGQVNAFFENPTAFYRSIPNPNLKPEKSRTFELGARGRFASLNLDASVFTGRFRDFIEEQRQVGGSGRPGDPLVFQSINIANVSISGFELKGDMTWGRFGGGVLSTPFAYGQTRGEDKNTSRPLNSIMPARLNAGVRYDTGPWMVRLDATYRDAKDREDIDSAALLTPPAQQFATPSATTLDFNAQWRLRPNVRLTAGIYNLTDRKYWDWSDVRGLATTSPVLDAYTQPGRNVRLTLVAEL